MPAMITEETMKRNLSANVAALLAARGKTNYWLMKELELSPGFYRVLSGETCPSTYLTARIADKLEVTVDDLLQSPQKKILACA